MSSSTIGNQIVHLLNSIDSYNQLKKQTMSSSDVSKTNPYRPLLEDVRNCLLHFDSEKRNRIIFNITEFLENNPSDQKLVEVMTRILQVVQSFINNKGVLFSPSKKPSEARPFTVTNDKLIRPLFQEVNDLTENNSSK
ncbi:hypothetical protein [Candidatus Neptunochlamydia vexilliferae]|uniref:Uncharacterized protein n=1 Tax=Candidatus Neptunichlamydia vexilliferae TaxID=1651774 RepID=A0ABS0B0S5_9BACT|nr:hypothetical protein [Candidatus Neptunochlamydia vexilliferae]MBF5059805.1 hypothetical protein [Candidatus Neptunochlamydia vexilliferae]